MAEPDGSHGSPVATRTGGGFLVSLVAGGGGPDLPRGSPRRQNGAVWRPLDPPIAPFNPTGAEGPRPQPKAPFWSPHTHCRQGCRLRWVVGLKDTQKVPLAPREFGQGAKCAISTITCSLCGSTASWQQKKRPDGPHGCPWQSCMSFPLTFRFINFSTLTTPSMAHGADHSDCDSTALS